MSDPPFMSQAVTLLTVTYPPGLFCYPSTRLHTVSHGDSGFGFLIST